jgi:hypothetical protein
VFAGDEELFAGLVPGVPLADEELAGVYGRGAISLDFSNGGLNNAPLDLSQAVDQISSISNNRGITTPIQFVGDHNQVSVNINIAVNIGTVSVLNPVGSTVNATAAVDFTGAIDFGLGQ